MHVFGICLLMNLSCCVRVGTGGFIHSDPNSEMKSIAYITISVLRIPKPPSPRISHLPKQLRSSKPCVCASERRDSF